MPGRQDLCPDSNDCGPVTVGFYAGDAEATRTAVDPNGVAVRWTAGDKISVWAENSSYDYTLEKNTFSTYGISANRGFFTATLAEPMAEDTYTYYATFPVPASVSGTTATFNVPARQNGQGYEVMVATPVEHGALTSIPEPEDHSGMSMQFNHKLHLLKLYVPEGEDKIDGESIQKIVVSMPQNVVGTVSADYLDASVPTSLVSGGESVITLNLFDPLKPSTSGSTYYAYVSVVPFTASGTDAMAIKTYSETKIGWTDPISLEARTFEEGHATPVKIRLARVSNYCKIYLKYEGGNLGEAPKKVTLTAPSGCKWGDDGSNVVELGDGNAVMVNGDTFCFTFEDENEYRAFSGQDITVTFDTEHALVSKTVKMPSMSSGYSANISLTTPYLLFEDFSTVGSISSNDAYTGGFSSGSKDGKALVNGWYGARVGAQAGTSVRIAGRRETSADYGARLDSPALSGLKEGVSVSVKVEYDYGFNREEGGIGSNPKMGLYVFNGTTTKTGAIKSGESAYSANPIDWIMGGEVAVNLGVAEGTFDQYFTATATDGSYTSMPNTATIYQTGIGPANRLSWFVVPTHAAGLTNGTYWLYVDNIRVSID